MRELPVACELSASEIEARRDGLLPGLLVQAQERLRLSNGFRWRFAPSGELLAAAAKTIDAERQCCRFLKFVFTIEPGLGAMWLEITGPQGTTEFLATFSRE